jgi:predicted Rossmann fold nucleotide-binding protein DprA/Smf involved in DNA uptake
MMYSKNSLALLLICSQLGLEHSNVKPFTAREWNLLNRRLEAISLQPADLLSTSISDYPLELTTEERARIASLVSRDVQGELDRLASLGIFIITCADSDYPKKYRQRLKVAAPAVLFYTGEKALIGQPGIAVVGSRHLDEVGKECARFVGNACGMSGMVLYSGGARGVDTISMDSSIQARGTAVAVLADSLERAVKSWKGALGQGDLCLVTPYNPKAGFSVGAAMGRNRLIYSLADYAIVVASDAETGGTWAGASEALKNNWIPVFVLEHGQMTEGNKLLLKKGALGFPYPINVPPIRLPDWLNEKAASQPSSPNQLRLF